MVLEHAVLQVALARAEEFEAAFDRARSLLAASPGCRRISLSRCVEEAGRYLLLVEWERLEDHTEGFRSSPRYEEWRRALHHFYEPFPTVEHYRAVGGG